MKQFKILSAMLFTAIAGLSNLTIAQAQNTYPTTGTPVFNSGLTANYYINQSNSTSDFVLFGGTTYTDGAYLSLPGNNFPTPANSAQNQGEILFTAGLSTDLTTPAFSIYNKMGNVSNWVRHFSMNKSGVVSIGAPNTTSTSTLLFVGGGTSIGTTTSAAVNGLLVQGASSFNSLTTFKSGLSVTAGQVLIGTFASAPNSKYSLAVNGNVVASGCTIILPQSGTFPDYVFDKNYNLLSLKELEIYIQRNKHLPEVPSAAEVDKDGINTGDLLVIQMKKIEELTLYMIEMQKQLDALKQQNDLLKINASTNK